MLRPSFSQVVFFLFNSNGESRSDPFQQKKTSSPIFSSLKLNRLIVSLPLIVMRRTQRKHNHWLTGLLSYCLTTVNSDWEFAFGLTPQPIRAAYNRDR